MGKWLMVLMFMCVPSLSWAQEVVSVNSCADISWIANMEDDLLGYRLYVKKDGVASGVIKLGKEVTTYRCVDAGIVEGGEYTVELSAVDTSGNESEKAGPVLVSWPDVTSPTKPGNLRVVTVTVTVIIDVP